MKYWDASTDLPITWKATPAGTQQTARGVLPRMTESPKPVGPLPDYVELDGHRVEYRINPKGWGSTRARFICPICKRDNARYLYELENGKVGCRYHRPKNQHLAESKRERASVARTKAARKLRNGRWRYQAEALTARAERLEAEAARLAR